MIKLGGQGCWKGRAVLSRCVLKYEFIRNSGKKWWEEWRTFMSGRTESKWTLSRLENADKLREQYTYLLFLMKYRFLLFGPLYQCFSNIPGTLASTFLEYLLKFRFQEQTGLHIYCISFLGLPSNKVSQTKWFEQ